MTTEYLLQREIDNVLSVLTPGNALVMRVALHTGLRIGDCLNLRTEQLAPRFWITEGKTGKRRQIGLPQPLLNDLKNTAGNVWVLRVQTPKNTEPVRQSGKMLKGQLMLSVFARMLRHIPHEKYMLLNC